jgi:hypothetical protein
MSYSGPKYMEISFTRKFLYRPSKIVVEMRPVVSNMKGRRQTEERNMIWHPHHELLLCVVQRMYNDVICIYVNI